MLGIEIAVVSASDPNLELGGEHALEDIAGAPGVVVGGDHNHASPFVLKGLLHQRLGLFPGVLRVVGYAYDFLFWHATLDQVMLHQFCDTRIGSQLASTG